MAAVYAEGWQKAVVSPMTRADAAARDACGAPYAVLLAADGRVRAVLQVSWRDRYCEVIRLDARGRTVATHEFRGSGDGELFLFESRTWDGPDDAGEYEFPHVAARHHTRYRLDGRRVDIDEPLGDRGRRTQTQRWEEPPRLPVPAFGNWHELLNLAGAGGVEVADAVDLVLPVVAAVVPPWRPPSPLPPGDPAALFVSGTEYLAAGHGLRIEVHEAGCLRLPSGRVVAADPSSLDIDAKPYTVTVPPGVYPVTVSLARFVADPQHTRVAAVRLAVAERPATTWELGLRDGQDPLDLGYREYFGFGVDAGMACFIDAESCARSEDVWRGLGGLVTPRFTGVEDETMVAWSSGWGHGAYPVWIGRDDDGGVVCFVADMLLFGEDEDDD
ncbi:DUF4241 domain-containing protein [Saccharothrix algeriensis]|uniref:DUF4241 domain-containing protein n=2 Tax=Catellatospora bangladeshensis TaxID=310355 RepID=A0A8J3JL47_9ACTN|nr:hypothetical protein Cba03nite_39700 [Catellatospora bangladeshensis]